MALLDDIKEAVRAGQYWSSQHSVEEMQEDDIDEEEIVHATLKGRMIEHYPLGLPWPSCLVLGHLDDGSPLHAVWACAGSRDYAVLVTVYRPDPARWSFDFRKRVSP